MKKKIPFNSGDLVNGKYDGLFMILGHVWWPVEQTNAYYCLPIDEYGEPTSGDPIYYWDSGSTWTHYTPKQRAA